MSRLGWGKKRITEGCINNWYKDKPIGRMVEDMRDNHRLLAQEQGGGRHRDSVLVYDRVKFMRTLNLPEPDTQLNPAETYIELSVAVKFYEAVAKYQDITSGRIGEPFPICGKCFESMQVVIPTQRPMLDILLHGEHEDTGTACKVCEETYWKNRDAVIVHKVAQDA